MSLTIFIPAFNEEQNLRFAVENAIKAVNKSKIVNYEILILNAFSTDKTGEIADKLVLEDSKIKVIHRKRWYGLGTNYMKGIEHSTMDYFVMFPGDNENSWVSLADSLKKIGQADMIIPYTVNVEARSMFRRIISKSYVLIMNFFFNLKLKYYNGNVVYNTSILKKISIKSEGFAYSSEIIIKSIKSGYSYIEFGIKIHPTQKTAIFNFKNIISVIKSFIILFFEVNVTRKFELKK